MDCEKSRVILIAEHPRRTYCGASMEDLLPMDYEKSKIRPMI